MPEIAEVARFVHFLRKHAVGRTIEAVKTTEDDIVYGKVGTSASAFNKAMTGKKILDARQHGKYFWLVMETQPHPLMHLGMTGAIKFSNDATAHYRPQKADDESWPPRFWKFVLQLKEDPKAEVAFVDSRRLGRIRLIDVDAEDMRKTSPLKENGPDPVLNKDILTVDWLSKKLRSKKVPIKALLLNSNVIAGIGNWVGDEIMYQAHLHPEQYSNTFTDEQIKRLHDAMMYVCDTAVAANGNSDDFPQDWLMKHRWGKGKKDGDMLPNGDKITFLTVGGRTSAIVSSRQKKMTATVDDVSESTKEGDIQEEEAESKQSTKRTTKAVREKKHASEEATKTPPRSRRGRKKAEDDVEEEPEAEADETPILKKRKITANVSSKRSPKAPIENVRNEDTSGMRRSTRLSR